MQQSPATSGKLFTMHVVQDVSHPHDWMPSVRCSRGGARGGGGDVSGNSFFLIFRIRSDRERNRARGGGSDVFDNTAVFCLRNGVGNGMLRADYAGVVSSTPDGWVRTPVASVVKLTEMD